MSTHDEITHFPFRFMRGCVSPKRAAIDGMAKINEGKSKPSQLNGVQQPTVHENCYFCDFSSSFWIDSDCSIWIEPSANNSHLMGNWTNISASSIRSPFRHEINLCDHSTAIRPTVRWFDVRTHNVYPLTIGMMDKDYHFCLLWAQKAAKNTKILYA